MATLSQFVTQVRDEILEPTAGFWTDAEIKRWLQEANDDLTRLAHVEAAPSEIAVVADTESYALPSDFGQARRVELEIDTDSWVELHRSRVDERLPTLASGISSTKGRPVRYFVWNDLLYLTPVPDAAYTLNLWYYRKGNTLSADGDEPIIPDEYHWILRTYAVARAKRKADDPAYQTYAADYASAVADMRRKLRPIAGRYRRVLDVG